MPNLIAYDRRQFLRLLAAFAPAAASTLPAYEFVPAKFGKLMVPTLLVMGSQTADHHRVAIEALGRVLPNQTIVTLQGQGHDAIEAAPELFTNAVLEFLKSRPPS